VPEPEQYQLFATPRYIYRVFVTDLDAPIDVVVGFYRQRAGAENLSKEAHNDGGLAAHPSARWSRNCVHFQLAMLAYNLNCWLMLFHREEPAKVADLHHTTLVTTRLRFLFLAAKIVRHPAPSWCGTAITTRMGIALLLIHQLYRVEKCARGLTPVDRLILRQRDSTLILAKLHGYLEEIQTEILPKSPEGRAVRYTLKNWTALTRYAEDGDLEIDNNATERTIRGVAVGRYSWVFFGSDQGGKKGRGAAQLRGVLPAGRSRSLHLAERRALADLRPSHHPARRTSAPQLGAGPTLIHGFTLDESGLPRHGDSRRFSRLRTVCWTPSVSLSVPSPVKSTQLDSSCAGNVQHSWENVVLTTETSVPLAPTTVHPVIPVEPDKKLTKDPAGTAGVVVSKLQLVIRLPRASTAANRTMTVSEVAIFCIMMTPGDTQGFN
jgi:hypothetical protein